MAGLPSVNSLFGFLTILTIPNIGNKRYIEEPNQRIC